MIFARIVQRTQILEVLGPRQSTSPAFPISSPQDVAHLAPHNVAAVWSIDPARASWELPEILVTADGAERDWMAWLTTYAPNIRPLTAYCRVMGETAFGDRWSAIRAPDLGRLGCAAVGIILGEVFSSSEDGPLRLRDPVSVPSSASVLSFSLVRAISLYTRPVEWMDQLARRWVMVREMTRQRPRTLSPRVVMPVMQSFGQLVPSSGIVADDEATGLACMEILEQGELESPSRTLGTTFGGAARAMALATREERLAILEESLSAPTLSDVDGFKVGYLASRMDPGSFAHAGLLATVLRRCPSALIWYGFCAGLSGGSALLNEFGGVGRRILRELLVPETLVGRPRTDIGFEELDLLLGTPRSPRPEDGFPTGSPSTLSVELDVGVPTAVNWGRVDPARNVERDEDRARLDADIGLVIQRLLEVQRRLRPQPDPPPERLFERTRQDLDQPSLFSPARRGERRPSKKH